MDRLAFITLSGAALVGLPRVAEATGGVDIAGPAAQHSMRVLLAGGTFAPPQQLDAWHFGWDGRTYRGTFSTVRLDDGRDGLLNTLPLDAYLYGVLSKEVSPSWSSGAQQAQAIVARTYALGRLRPAKPYDVVASESDQRYGGIESESVEGRAAIDATGGIVVTYGAAPARMAYSSCCGGKTADAAEAWKTPYPYLAGVIDPHCSGTPNYDWRIDVPLSLVQSAFGGQLAAAGALRSVALEGATGPTDRPRSIDFVGDASTFVTTPSAFRASLGATVIRSTFVRVASLERDTLSLTGTGRGHGVGMCQWGARVMGEAGSTAQDIVAFYFPGTSLGRA
ncbi:MAG: SpoIID/LytB domain-containing protein [Candidatus Eremiobacteraeota bacterium]|nr:SpoIID/LytB domain-containing protein [Candidatus Eremiobacteraeota bacterium]